MEAKFDISIITPNTFYFYRSSTYSSSAKYERLSIKGNRIFIQKPCNRVYIYVVHKERDNTNTRYVYSLLYVAVWGLGNGFDEANLRNVKGDVVGKLTFSYKLTSKLIDVVDPVLESKFSELCQIYSKSVSEFLSTKHPIATYINGKAIKLKHRNVNIPLHGLYDVPMCFFFYYALHCDWVRDADIDMFLNHIVVAVLEKYGESSINFIERLDNQRETDNDVNIICEFLKFITSLVSYTPDRNGDNFSITWAMIGLSQSQMDCEDMSLFIGFMFHLIIGHNHSIPILKSIKTYLEKKTLVYCLVTAFSGDKKHPEASHLMPILVNTDWKSNGVESALILESMGDVRSSTSVDYQEDKRDVDLPPFLKPRFTKRRAFEEVYRDVYRIFEVNSDKSVIEYIPVTDEKKRLVGISLESFIQGASFSVLPVFNWNRSDIDIVSKMIKTAPWKNTIAFTQSYGSKPVREHKNCKKNGCRVEWFLEHPGLEKNFKNAVESGVLESYLQLTTKYYICDDVYASLVKFVLA